MCSKWLISYDKQPASPSTVSQVLTSLSASRLVGRFVSDRGCITGKPQLILKVALMKVALMPRPLPRHRAVIGAVSQTANVAGFSSS
jgi:hypothetical protein